MPEDLLGLTGKVVIVSGAGRGIGRGCALMFAQAGAHVVASSLHGENAEKAAQEAAALGPEALGIQADARKPEDMDRVVAAALKKFGRLDAGVNNVGGSHEGWGYKLLLDASVEDWVKTLEQSLVSSAIGCRAFAKGMIECGSKGSIVNVSSSAALRAAVRLGPYGAAKAGVAAMTQTLAVELAPYGIRVNCVAPSFISTPGLSHFTPTDQQAAYAKRVTPLGRVGQPEDIAGVVVFLASRLAGYLTGQHIVADGGRLSTNTVSAAVD